MKNTCNCRWGSIWVRNTSCITFDGKQKNVVLYLPESFEWMILKAGVLKNSQVEKLVNDPSEFVESSEYFSWERFFTAVLIEATKDTYLAYAKKN